MTTATKAPAKFDLLVNVPVTLDIKYVDVWPDTKGFGSQVSIKGTLNGETQTTFLKGKTWANLKALREAGVIAPYDKSIEEPAEKVNVPVAMGTGVTLCRQQLAGEKYASLLVSRGTPPVTNGKTPSAPAVDDGPPIWDNEEEAPPPQPVTTPVNPAREKLIASFKLYDACFDHALKIAHRVSDGNHDVAVDVCAVAATLFIQANR